MKTLAIQNYTDNAEIQHCGYPSNKPWHYIAKPEPGNTHMQLAYKLAAVKHYTSYNLCTRLHFLYQGNTELQAHIHPGFPKQQCGLYRMKQLPC